jgi:hypothetical protein
MNRFLLAVLALCISASPALAAQTVYLKEGGKISAQSVWRTKGKVHVLVNRDTLTEFSSAEIDLKRTFARKHRVTKRRPPLSCVSLAAVPGADKADMAQKTGE